MATATTTNSFVQRFLGALALDTGIYEEVERDVGATTQAFVMVVLASAAAGIGARGYVGGSPANVLFISIIALLVWAAWALVTFQIGARLMPTPETRADVGELLRTIGFASAPGVLRVFGAIPQATIPVFAITWVWMLCTMIVAVRQALDYRSTARAIAVCVLGWALAIAFAVGLGIFLTPPVS